MRVPSQPPKKQILKVAVEKFLKSAVKHFIWKTILSNFVNLPTIFFPSLYIQNDKNKTKTSNNEHDWALVKYMFCITIDHKISCYTFFLKYCKNITNFLFWVLWICLATSKNGDANFDKLWCLLACKKWTTSLSSYLIFCKDAANCFGKFGTAWPPPSKSWYRFVRNIHAYLHLKNRLYNSILS